MDFRTAGPRGTRARWMAQGSFRAVIYESS
ncbi:protein of unknown function (plasmid) [Cupriavidus taiwanensis]|uniref:Uncharacterized protein n=1 Tax=Cupriavidus taiwanensis TaxID=164546 RepID=A0A9Q7V173_9BURK|nr:protein of unknown function [Cupriavidus taiwanensis]